MPIAIGTKKKKLTDIGFIGFSWIKGNGFFFQWIWISD
jgi:hypothetical protein